MWRPVCLHPYSLKWTQCAKKQLHLTESEEFFPPSLSIQKSKFLNIKMKTEIKSKDIKQSCLSQALIWLTMLLVVSELFVENLCKNHPQHNASRLRKWLSESEIFALLHFWLSEQACWGFMRLLTSPKVKYFSKPSWYMP